MSEESCSLATEIVAFYDGKYSKNSKNPDFSDQLRYVLAGVGFFGGSMVTGLLGLHNTQILPLLGAVIGYIVDSKKAMQGVVNSLKGFSKSTNAPKRALLVDSLERAARECPSRGS